MMTTEKFLKIAQELEIYHGVFSQFWQMGKPLEDPTIERAAIRFDKSGGFFSFVFNPDFYKTLDDYNLKFIICHEAMHVILNHGMRMKGLNSKICNIAMDVVINESLVKNFNFSRSMIMDADNYCWYDTVFPNDTTISKNRSFEYYYEMLEKDEENQNGNGSSSGGNGKNNTVDSHENFCADAGDEISSILDQIGEKLSDEEKENLKNSMESILDDDTKNEIHSRGTIAGGISRIMSTAPVKIKRKWETVIKKWAQLHMKKNDREYEQWARVNRRFVTLSKEMFIPTSMEIENFNEEKHKIKVLFFLDTSGSCSHLADRFWTAAKSLPPERFDIQLCCFDTMVYETSFASGKLYGFGGTSFDILEEYAQQYRKNPNKGKGRYPDAVFVITDGMGNSVSPEFPKKWYWFLSYNYTYCIPKECNIFQLADYE